jgi:hypothetical protein
VANFVFGTDWQAAGNKFNVDPDLKHLFFLFLPSCNLTSMYYGAVILPLEKG